MTSHFSLQLYDLPLRSHFVKNILVAHVTWDIFAQNITIKTYCDKKYF